MVLYSKVLKIKVQILKYLYLYAKFYMVICTYMLLLFLINKFNHYKKKKNRKHSYLEELSMISKHYFNTHLSNVAIFKYLLENLLKYV